MTPSPFGWFAIIRLGLVQTALGAIVVLTTSTINRIMVIELALPAMVPGALVTLHYTLQLLRPRWGYGSDVGGRRTPWIFGGMVVLALGGTGAAAATALLATDLNAGLALATLAFTLIGIGVGACGTSLLALLAKRVEPHRRAAAATIVWLMMIAGFAVTAGVVGSLLDPFTPARLVSISAVLALIAVTVTGLALFRLEGRSGPQPAPSAVTQPRPPFRAAFKSVWNEPEARLFAVFIFVSMLAYSAQDLILEPFAGALFGMTPGQSTKLAGVQHGGVFVGMVLVGLAGAMLKGTAFGSTRNWTVFGCLASALSLFAVAGCGVVGPGASLREAVFALGLSNGIYASAAIGTMMGLAGGSQGERSPREGMRMGLWGAAQAVAFGLGGFAGTVIVDTLRPLFADPLPAYGAVFLTEGVLFILSAALALRIRGLSAPATPMRAQETAQTGGLALAGATPR